MNGIIMKSKNFEFLRDRWPELASLGGFAEQYVRPDPPGALVKLRTFVESLIHRFYDEHGIPKPSPDSLIELLNADEFRQSVPAVVLNAFHSIRLAGNKAAHGEPVARFNAPELLKEAFHLGCWFFIINGGRQGDCPAYHAPDKIDRFEKTKEELKRDKQRIQEALASKESEMLSLLTEFEAARVKTRVTEKKVVELEKLLFIGKTAADAMGFDEAATRKRLIDTELAAVGWDVGTNGTNTGEVTQESEIQHQKTETGIGYADYVLWDDNGQPLAVIGRVTDDRTLRIRGCEGGDVVAADVDDLREAYQKTLDW